MHIYGKSSFLFYFIVELRGCYYYYYFFFLILVVHCYRGRACPFFSFFLFTACLLGASYFFVLLVAYDCLLYIYIYIYIYKYNICCIHVANVVFFFFFMC